MESLLEAYGDESQSGSKSPSPKVTFYEDVSSEGDSGLLSQGQSVRDKKFDEALLKFYMTIVKRQKPEPNEQTVFTRYSGKYFSSVAKSLTPHQVSVIHKSGAGSFLKFEKTDVPLRFVKWIAGKFDTWTSEIQVTSNFIPVTKETIHNILELPIGGLEVVPDREAGRNFILSHFNVPSVPQVSYFGSKLKSEELFSDEDIFICFMVVMFQSFMCPNSSLQPSLEYLHLLRDPDNFMKHDISKFVHEWLVLSINKFQKATKLSSRRQLTLGGNHYCLAVAYLDSVDFGLKSLPNTFPRVLVWRGSRIREYAELDKCSANSFGKRPLKDAVHSCKVQRKKPNISSNSRRKSFRVQNPEDLFIKKLSAMFTPILDVEQLKTISEIVKVNSHGKPADFKLCPSLKVSSNDKTLSSKNEG
ncbi:hypothetical protein ACQ4PT_057822 [Festuca glaucescens]